MREIIPGNLNACALRIVEAKRRLTISTAACYYQMGEALEIAYGVCKNNGGSWRNFLIRTEVKFTERRARELRDFYRTYKKYVDKNKRFFTDTTLKATTLTRLLKFKGDTRDTLLTKASQLKKLTTSAIEKVAGEIEGRVVERDSYEPSKEESRADELTTSERKELAAYRNAVNFLAGRNVGSLDTKDIIDAVLDNQSTKMDELLDTPLKQFAGYNTIREWMLKYGINNTPPEELSVGDIGTCD